MALELLKNASIAAGMVLPGCQDTGTAICMGEVFQLFLFTNIQYMYSETPLKPNLLQNGLKVGLEGFPLKRGFRKWLNSLSGIVSLTFHICCILTYYLF